MIRNQSNQRNLCWLQKVIKQLSHSNIFVALQFALCIVNHIFAKYIFSFSHVGLKSDGEENPVHKNTCLNVRTWMCQSFFCKGLLCLTSAVQQPQRETVTLLFCPIEFSGLRQLQSLCSINNTYRAMTAGFDIHRKSKPHPPLDTTWAGVLRDRESN